MITLTNNFHDTEITLRLPELDFGQSQEISEHTYKRIHRELCGSDTCTCGGARGDQTYSVEERAPGRYFVCRTDFGRDPFQG